MTLKNISLWIVLVTVSFTVLYLLEDCSLGRATMLAGIIGAVKAVAVAANERVWSYLERHESKSNAS